MSDTMIAIVGSIATGLLLKVGDWLINRSKDGREASKDYREEIKELWQHSDDQDVKIKALQDRLIEKDKTIAELQAKIGEEMFWKQRFTAENLRTQLLERELAQMRDHIDRLEMQIKELQK
jgi:DNA repair exonuclease SbcCD ATPase subunit